MKTYVVGTHLKHLSLLDVFFLKKAMPRRAGGRALGIIRGLPFGYLFSKLYVTFILQWIAFIFGRNEEEDQ